MKFLRTASVVAFVLTAAVSAADQWTFADGSLSVAQKGSEATKHKLEAGGNPSAVTISSSDTLKIALTAKDGKTGKRPHQAFLTLQDPAAGLEESFAFNVRENGKAKLDISHKDLPFQFLSGAQPLKAFIVLGSFGSSTPFKEMNFDINIVPDASSPKANQPRPERYEPKPEIHHIFKDDPKSPPKAISLVFTLAVLVSLPALFGAWLLLGGNLGHLGKAFGAKPVAHGLFFGSIIAIEGVFALYYASWNLFQTLPVAGVLGVVAFVSGSRALTEVQERRLTGQR
ncbi:unnamed protein product [Zymoseptoria tritici ST99CH_3D1]|nr:unnamed protein product [Zymoseptoria tritici ST99CH_3D1]